MQSSLSTQPPDERGANKGLPPGMLAAALFVVLMAGAYVVIQGNPPSFPWNKDPVGLEGMDLGTLQQLQQERREFLRSVATSREPADTEKIRSRAQNFNRKVDAWLDRLEAVYTPAAVQSVLTRKPVRGEADSYELLRRWLLTQPAAKPVARLKSDDPDPAYRVVFASANLPEPEALASGFDPAQLKAALADELVSVYVYIGRDQDSGWRVAQAACGLFALTAPCLAPDWKVVLPWVPGKPQRGVVFGFDEKPDDVLNLGQTESLTYVRHAIAKAD